MLKTCRMLKTTVIVVLFTGMSGCATYSDVTVYPMAPGKRYQAAYVVAHAGRSSDIDTSMQAALASRGLQVKAGAEGQYSEHTDLVFRYEDSWRWDWIMYLRRLEIQVYDADSHTQIASGQWGSDSPYGYKGLDKAVAELMDELFRKANFDGRSGNILSNRNQ